MLSKKIFTLVKFFFFFLRNNCFFKFDNRKREFNADNINFNLILVFWAASFILVSKILKVESKNNSEANTP